MQASYAFNNGLEVYVGGDNLFDEDPPPEFLGTGGGSGLFDNIGRFYDAGLTLSFQ